MNAAPEPEATPVEAAYPNDAAAEFRLLWLAVSVSVVFVAGSLFLSGWRVTSGLALGCVLSLLNFYWLKISLQTLLRRAADDNGADSRFTAAFYILRYAIIFLTVGVAVTLDFVSVAATLVGLLSFAFAILLEAVIQFFIIIVQRKED